MDLDELEITPGERFTPTQLEDTFDRGMTGRGIEICYDSENQRYLRVFSDEAGPYSDNVHVGQFTYIGDGKTGDQEFTHGNRVLGKSKDVPLPIFFFYKEAGGTDWEYQGLIEVVDYEYGYLEEEGRKVYQFTLQRLYEGTELVDRDEAAADLDQPKRIEVKKSRVIRNTALVKERKEAYSYRCQVCGTQRQQGDGRPYAEGHHLKPLGRPHEGPDDAQNILILCPDHHADFDYGMIKVDPKTLEITHTYDDAVDGNELYVESEHSVGQEWLKYHNKVIVGSSN